MRFTGSEAGPSGTEVPNGREPLADAGYHAPMADPSLPESSDGEATGQVGPSRGQAFRVEAPFRPAGDQPQAIRELADGIQGGERFQTLLGITGSGKSATIAWTIEQVQRPTLVIAPNKALAAQLANELREFFPDNRVEYFVSYYAVSYTHLTLPTKRIV